MPYKLPKDRQYEFRYRLDDDQWENDWLTDAYISSPVSCEGNSVIQL